MFTDAIYSAILEGCNHDTKKKLNEDDDVEENEVNDDLDLDDLTEGLHVEDDECNAIIVESMLVESIGTGEELEAFLNEEAHLYVKRGLLSEKSIVRLDKMAKLSKAESQAVLAIAKERGDRDYKKLKTIYKMRKLLLDKLTKKYFNEARRRAKTMMSQSKNMAGKTAKKLK